jgi:hypothetical protein
MDTTVNLLLILIFLSAVYTLLGLICGVADRVRGLITNSRRSLLGGAPRPVGVSSKGFRDAAKPLCAPPHRRIPVS